MTRMQSAGDLYPWLAEPWRTLGAHIASGRLPQALLIQGAVGLGKMRLAELFAQRLLCGQPEEFACGDCHACRLFLAGTHPDFIKIEPAEPGKGLSVDAVRHLIAHLALKPQYGGHRIVIISPAHQMNLNAANALLKTLEEPAERTVMLLLTDAPSALPATILSRCLRLPVPTPHREPSLCWLNEQGVRQAAEVLLDIVRGAPLRALAVADSDVMERRRTVFDEWSSVLAGREQPIAVAGRWEKWSPEEIVDWLLSWTVDLVRLRSAPGCKPLYNPDLGDALQLLAGSLHLENLLDLWSSMLQTKRALSGQANRQLLLEELLIGWSRLRSCL